MCFPTLRAIRRAKDGAPEHFGLVSGEASRRNKQWKDEVLD
jgi:hypothetical protein